MMYTDDTEVLEQREETFLHSLKGKLIYHLIEKDRQSGRKREGG